MVWPAWQFWLNPTTIAAVIGLLASLVVGWDAARQAEATYQAKEEEKLEKATEKEARREEAAKINRMLAAAEKQVAESESRRQRERNATIHDLVMLYAQ